MDIRHFGTNFFHHTVKPKKRENIMFDTTIIEDTLEVKTADFFQKSASETFEKKSWIYLPL